MLQDLQGRSSLHINYGVFICAFGHKQQWCQSVTLLWYARTSASPGKVNKGDICCCNSSCLTGMTETVLTCSAEEEMEFQTGRYPLTAIAASGCTCSWLFAGCVRSSRTVGGQVYESRDRRCMLTLLATHACMMQCKRRTLKVTAGGYLIAPKPERLT